MMKDCELEALSAVLQSETMLKAGENRQREIAGYSPAWTFESAGRSDVEQAIVKELVER